MAVRDGAGQRVLINAKKKKKKNGQCKKQGRNKIFQVIGKSDDFRKRRNIASANRLRTARMRQTNKSNQQLTQQ